MLFALYILSLTCFASCSGSPISPIKHKNRFQLSKSTVVESNSPKLKNEGPKTSSPPYKEHSNKQFFIKNVRIATESAKTTPLDRRFYPILTQKSGESASMSEENIDSGEGKLSESRCSHEEKAEKAYVREFSLQVKGVMRKYINKPSKVYDKESKPKIKFIAVPRAENGEKTSTKYGLQRIVLYSQEGKRRATTMRVISTGKGREDRIRLEISKTNKANSTDSKVGDMLWNLALQFANAFSGTLSSSNTKTLDSTTTSVVSTSPKPVFPNKFKNARSSLSNVSKDYKDASSAPSEKYERSRLRNEKQKYLKSSRTFNKSTLQKYVRSNESKQYKQPSLVKSKSQKHIFSDHSEINKEELLKYKTKNAKSDESKKYYFASKEHNNFKTHELNRSKKHQIKLYKSEEEPYEKSFLSVDEDSATDSLSADNRLWFETTKARSKNMAKSKVHEQQRRKRYKKLKRNMKTTIKKLTTNSARYKIKSFMNHNSRDRKLSPGIPRQHKSVIRQSDSISDVTTIMTAKPQLTIRTTLNTRRLLPAFADTKSSKTAGDIEYDMNRETILEEGLSSLETYAELHNIKLNYKTVEPRDKLSKQKTKSKPTEQERFYVKPYDYSTENKNLKPQDKYFRHNDDSQNLTNKSIFLTSKRYITTVNLLYSTPRTFNHRGLKKSAAPMEFEPKNFNLHSDDSLNLTNKSIFLTAKRHLTSENLLYSTPRTTGLKKSAAPIKFKQNMSRFPRTVLSYTTPGIRRVFDGSEVSRNFAANNSSYPEKSIPDINLNNDATNSSRNSNLPSYLSVKENSLRSSANFSKTSKKMTSTIKMEEFTSGRCSNFTTVSLAVERRIALLDNQRMNNKNDTLLKLLKSTTVNIVDKHFDFNNFI